MYYLRDCIETVAASTVYINQNNIGSDPVSHFDELAIVRGFPNNTDLGVELKHGLEAGPKGGVIPRDEDADGRSS